MQRTVARGCPGLILLQLGLDLTSGPIGTGGGVILVSRKIDWTHLHLDA